MALYKVIAEQKITKKIIVVVEASSDDEAIDKVRNRDVISVESTLDMKIDEIIPLVTDKY